MTDKLQEYQRFKTYLESLSHASLVNMLLEQAQRDEALAQCLQIQSTPLGENGALIQKLRAQIEKVTYPEFLGHWRNVETFITSLEKMVDALEGLLNPTYAGALIGFAQYAIECLDKVYDAVDDSDGKVSDVITRLGDLHLSACQFSHLTLPLLAQDLFRLQTTLGYGPDFGPKTYQTVLGPAGLEQYRALAQTTFDLFDTSSEDLYSTAYSRVSRILIELAEMRNDVDGIIAIKAKNLSYSGAYLQIAEILTQNLRHSEALQWAERGLRAFPERTDNGLRDFLVSVYLKNGRNEEAIHLTWLQFEERPYLFTYQKLHGVASVLGVWPAQRTRALEYLAHVIEEEAKNFRSNQPNTSRQVEIALWEGELDTAWNALNQGECPQDLHIQVARAIEATQPNDALSIYLPMISSLVTQTNNRAYEQAIGLIERVQIVMRQQDKHKQFLAYLTEWKTTFKRKINFIKMLEEMIVES